MAEYKEAYRLDTQDVDASVAAGFEYRAMLDRLNADGQPTVRGGGKWRPSSVQVAAGYKRPRRQQLRSLPDENGSPRKEE